MKFCHVVSLIILIIIIIDTLFILQKKIDQLSIKMAKAMCSNKIFQD